jgi:hypothetical protein
MVFGRRFTRIHGDKTPRTKNAAIPGAQKGDRPLCPLEKCLGRLQDCGLGTE